jgi:hypothetical protein
LVLLELPDLSVAEMFAKSDLVIQGRVRQMTPELTPDDTSIHTDVIVEPQAVIKGNTKTSTEPTIGASSDRPGVVPGLRVRVAGGEMEINGQKARVVYSDLPVSSIQIGAVYILFLRSWPGHDEKFLTGVTAGIFEVRNGRVMPVAKQTHDLHTELQDMPLQQFLAKLR